MMTRTTLHAVAALASLAFIAGLAGCATPASPVTASKLGSASVGAKIPSTVLLVLSPETCAYVHEDKLGAVVPMGDAICKYAEESVGDAFLTVIVKRLNQSSSDGRDVGVILAPKVAASSVALPMWAWNDMTSIVIVEWTATDPTGRPIWSKTFRGEASGASGSNFKLAAKRSELLNKALHEAFSASRAGFLAADGVRQLAKPTP